MTSQTEAPEMEQADVGAARSGPTLMQIAWQRKSLVILGVIIGLVLGLLYYAQKQPTYQSTAQILVVKKTPSDSLNLGQDSGRIAYLEDYMSTQQELVRSPAILDRASKKTNIQNLRSFPGERQENLMYAIRESLQVLRDNRDNQAGIGNNILTLQFKGPEADECPKILEAIIISYQEFLDETYKSVSDKTFELIMAAKRELSLGLDQAEQEYADFRLKNPFTMVRAGDGSNANIYVTRLAKLEARRSELRMHRAELQEKLNVLRRVLKEQGEAAARQKLAMLGVKLNLMEGMAEYEKRAIDLELALRRLKQRYGEKHPDVQELMETIRHLRERFEGGSAALLNPDSGSQSQPIRNLNSVESYIAAMEAEIQDDDAILATIEGMFETEQRLARDMAQTELNEERFRNRIASHRQMFEAIMKRVNEVNLVRDFGGYEAKPISPPHYGRKIAPNPLTVFPVSAFGGLLLGLSLAYLAEISDKSFRTPAEIRRRLGLPVIGHIPYFTPDEKAQKLIEAGEPAVDPMLCTHYASNSVSAEAYRSVRTAIYFNTQGIGHQVIQVTSPNMSDGKSTLVANLAVSIAQSGKKTILIDADCRRPRGHKIFNVSHDTGLASVIAGQSDLASAIRPTAIPNLAILPCGPRPANPAELLTSPRFKELLDIIRAQYDYVLVDTPPLLVVTDPCVVAPRVDGVILAIRVTKNGRPFAERAKEILTSLGANVLGVVVNGLGGQAGGRYGYGYDSYNYGYGYGYTYRYSYTYTDEYTEDKSADYYQAPANAEMPPLPPAPVGTGGERLSESSAADAPPEVAESQPPPVIEQPAAPPRPPADEESYPAS